MFLIMKIDCASLWLAGERDTDGAQARPGAGENGRPACLGAERSSAGSPLILSAPSIRELAVSRRRNQPRAVRRGGRPYNVNFARPQCGTKHSRRRAGTGYGADGVRYEGRTLRRLADTGYPLN
jgi:hypothetical protein